MNERTAPDVTEPKAILISGGARGIGRCIARGCTGHILPSSHLRFTNFGIVLEHGHKVFILDIDEEELKYTTGVHLSQHSDRLGFAICDLRNITDIRNKVQAAADFFNGHIDVLINNGGIANPYWKDGVSMDDPAVLDQWQAYVETNLTAPFAVSSACIPYMKAQSQSDKNHTTSAGACIIHMGSFRALQSDPNQEGYASTKAGQLGLMHSMAVTCSQWGIRVNLVAPGRIKVAHECREGDEKGTSFEETLTEDDMESHATNRAGRPMDVLRAVYYLVESGFVTGQALTVDGGKTIQK
jgi:NAD(P)-dependent dehydrogenase (short-subunit alcohol dehydrogenase family)